MAHHRVRSDRLDDGVVGPGTEVTRLVDVPVIRRGLHIPMDRRGKEQGSRVGLRDPHRGVVAFDLETPERRPVSVLMQQLLSPPADFEFPQVQVPEPRELSAQKEFEDLWGDHRVPETQRLKGLRDARCGLVHPTLEEAVRARPHSSPGGARARAGARLLRVRWAAPVGRAELQPVRHPAYRERLDDAGALALASSSRLGGLRFLDLSHFPLTENSKVAVLRALPALRACALEDLAENCIEDSIDGSTLGAMPSDALNAFEAAHGHFEALHEVDRTRSLVLLERY